MKLNRITPFVIAAFVLALILSQSASVAVKAQVSGNLSASLSQQPKIQNPKSKIQNPTTCNGFSAVTSFNYPNDSNSLSAVAALAPDNVWAVGSYNDGVTVRALIEHWNGSAWTVMLDADPGSDHEFYGITALAPDNIWAVGTSHTVGNHYSTLTEHWDGSAWSIIPSANPNADTSQLNAVAGASANDVWAVGYSSPFGNGVHNLLIEHWDGSAWTLFPIGTIGTGNTYLANIAVVNANEVWAVGYYQNGGPDVALALHWNGSVWQVVPTANPGNADFSGVTVLASNNVWAAGEYGSSGPLQTLTEQWNSSTWNVVPSPNVGATNNFLESVSALAANDIWSVGEAYNGTHYQTTAMHWDGGAWSIIPSDSPGAGANNFHAVVAVGSGDAWAVGDQSDGTTVQTLIEHYAVCVPTPTPTDTPTVTDTPTNTDTPTDTPTNAPTNTATYTPTAAPTGTPMPTNTPGGPTSTPRPTSTPIATYTPAPTITPQPTSTPGGPTPTDCPNPFVDVTGNIFYVAIHDLNCRGVINGTNGTHYSPAGTSTRGQFAKVVILGFGTLLHTPGTPDFSDVPTSYFAYLYIESGFHAGILSGFDTASCQAAGQPYPCYLPNRPITRGQLTKLVVNAAHYPLFTPTSGPTFTDVPTSNVFYASIETAAHKGVVSGYPDHTFRPNSNIRRDEMAQIVYKGVTTP